MKKILLALVMGMMCSAAHAQKIYSTDRAYEADVKVFVTDKEYKADLIVFETDKDYRAKASENKGIWFFTDRPFQADKKVYFVDKEYQADLIILYTDKEYRAGWKKNSKKYLLGTQASGLNWIGRLDWIVSLRLAKITKTIK